MLRPVVVGINATAMNISWSPPIMLNGPTPNYTVWRNSPAFNTPSDPPVPVENGVHFPGAGYYKFPPQTIPQGVSFTGEIILFLTYDSKKLV